MTKIYPKFLLLVFLLLTSCTRGSIYDELFQNLSTILFDAKDISIDEVEKVPYASKQARIGRSKNSLIVLEEVNNDILKWTSSNFVKVYTRENYVVKLTGLGNELSNIDLDRLHPANTNNFDDILYKELLSFYTFNFPSLFRLPVKTIFSFERYEEINVLGKKLKCKIYKEQSLENLINWKFENYFWVDKDGEIIKSTQFFSPKNPEINLLTTKKYKKPE